MFETRRLRTAVISISIVLSGCASSPPPQSSAPAATQPVAAGAPLSQSTAATPAPGHHDPADPLHGTAGALAQKTASYTRDMEPLIAKRSTPQPPEQPSNVKWNDPDPNASPQSPRPQQPQPAQQVNTAPPQPPSQVTTVVDNGSVTANQQLALATESKVSPTPSAIARMDEETVPVKSKPASAVAAPVVNSDALDRKLAQHVKDYPRDIAGQLDYQLLMLVREESVPQLGPVSTLPTEDREVVTAVIDGLSNFRNTVRADNNLLLSKKIQPILDLADRLRTQAELAIPTIALCTRVDGFGVYEPISPARFSAGKEHPVIVYCEVGNFASQVNEKKLWQTKLNQEAVLFTETGMPVWADKTKTITDLSRNRRHDFFLVKTIRLPGNLTIGRYLLKVTVVDQIASRVSEATVPVEIAAE